MFWNSSLRSLLKWLSIKDYNRHDQWYVQRVFRVNIVLDHVVAKLAHLRECDCSMAEFPKLNPVGGFDSSHVSVLQRFASQKHQACAIKPSSALSAFHLREIHIHCHAGA